MSKRMSRGARAREAFLASFYPDDDPLNPKTPEELEMIAATARSAYFRELGRRSGQSRRAMRCRLAELEARLG